jgi:hypothetical protein
VKCELGNKNAAFRLSDVDILMNTALECVTKSV